MAQTYHSGLNVNTTFELIKEKEKKNTSSSDLSER